MRLESVCACMITSVLLIDNIHSPVLYAYRAATAEEGVCRVMVDPTAVSIGYTGALSGMERKGRGVHLYTIAFRSLLTHSCSFSVSHATRL